MSQLKESQHLKISLRDIEVATKNFKTCIGKGGYGLVYKGTLSISGKDTMVAVKRLRGSFRQGLKEFLTEIQLLSGQVHPNLISLLGYCDEGEEKIIVYEYAERGSLDRYIRCRNTSYALTWLERLKVCADAARGLDHLHRHVGMHQTIIHRDIKSANILLDENGVAKISDLGLSKLCLAGLGRSAVITHACGTPGYCEPEYIMSGIVTRESDVYSFGMVLFEVLCGRLCSVGDDDGLWLSAILVKDYYENNKLDTIVDPSLRKQMSQVTFERFSAIAYACLLDDRRERPSMNIVTQVIEELFEIQLARCSDIMRIKMWNLIHRRLNEDFDIVVEEIFYPHDPYIHKHGLMFQGIQFQPADMMEHEEIEALRNPSTVNEDNIKDDEYWEKKLPQNYQDFVKVSDKPMHYVTKKRLYSLLCTGFHGDKGRTGNFILLENDKWFSLCQSTGICSMLSAIDILRNNFFNSPTLAHSESRFQEVKTLKSRKWHKFTCRLRQPMFSPLCWYAIYLVFKFADSQIQLGDARLWKIWYALDDIHQGVLIAHLNSPPPMNIPTIKSKNEYGSPGSSNIPKVKEVKIPKGSIEYEGHSWMEQRTDGWMEVMLCNKLHRLEHHYSLKVDMYSKIGPLHEIIVEGIEFRPVKKCI